MLGRSTLSICFKYIKHLPPNNFSISLRSVRRFAFYCDTIIWSTFSDVLIHIQNSFLLFALVSPSIHLFIYFSFIFISWRLITLQHCSGFCHTLTWISHGYTCIPHPDPCSHLPLHPIPLGLPSAPGLSTCLMHPTWAGDLFHYR